ncbi:hypothetical protein KKC13_02460 [bacterium]|nr:hypothetical protein [bacterium]MBU1958406.1 hypothetical protein [bacterium]
MKQIINSKLFSTIIFFLSVMVLVKVTWLVISLFFLPSSGEEYTQEGKAKALYYRVKLTNESAVIAPVVNNRSQAPVISSMQGFKLLALYNASDKLVVTVEKGSKTTILAKGEKVDGFTLSSAGSNYAIFTKAGKEFRLSLSKMDNNSQNTTMNTSGKRPNIGNQNKKDSTGIIEQDGKKIISKNLLDSYTKDVDKIWKDIGIGENKVDGKLNGFKINYVKQGSDFEKLGLKRGDLLMAINAEELNSYGAAMNFFKEIENIENLTLTVQRNGKSEDIEYEIQ